MVRPGVAVRLTAALALPIVAAGCSRAPVPEPVAASPTVMGAEVGREPGSPVAAALDDGAGVEVVAGAGAVWVAGTEQVLRIDPATNRIVARFDVGGFPTALAVAGGALWATTFRQAATLEQEIVKVDPATNEVTVRLPVGDVVQDLAASDTDVWVLTGGDPETPLVKLVHVDPAAGRVAGTVELKLPSLFVRLVAGPEGAFVMSAGQSPVLTHVRPDDRIAATIGLTAPPSGGIVYDAGAVWLVNRDRNTITKVDVAAGAVAGSYPLPPLPAYVTAGGGRLWVTIDPTSVVPVDPATGAAGEVLTVDAEAAADPDTPKRIRALAVDGDALWLVTGVGAWRVNPR
jgi:hypothetical protein